MPSQPQTRTEAATDRSVMPANANKLPVTTPQALKVAVSRGEAILLLLLVLLGMGVWAVADRLVTSYMKDREPREEQSQLSHGLPRLNASLAMTQDEQKSTQEQLIKTRLELAAHESALAALEAFPPAAKEKDGAAEPKSTPAAEGRAEALRKRAAAAGLTNSLIARLDALQQTADSLNVETERARHDAAGEFYRRRWEFLTLKALITLGLAAFALTVLLWSISMLRRARPLHGRVPGLSADGSLMWWTVAGLILVLFGYQAFEMAGAALAGVVVLLIFLARVPWPGRVVGEVTATPADPKAGTAEGA